MIEITHIAGLVITLDGHVRQRCAWCSTILVDQELANVAVPDDQPDKSFPTWPVLRLVTICGNASWTLGEDERLPLTACARRKGIE